MKDDAKSILTHSARGISEAVLQGRIDGSTGFYGPAFSYLSLSLAGAEFRQSLNLLGARLSPQQAESPIHWEFNRLAAQLVRLLRPGDSESNGIAAWLEATSFVYNRVANWTLLRATVRLLDERCSNLAGSLETRLALRYYQRPSGLIEDVRRCPSSQYHAFAVWLLLLQESVKPASSRRRHRTARALEVLAQFELAEGEINVIGRGSLQSFGYASAAACSILAPALGYEVYPSGKVLARLGRSMVGNRIPLNTRRGCDEDLASGGASLPPGWYSYNRWLDYWAFSSAVIGASTEIADAIGRTPAKRGAEFRRAPDSLQTDGICIEVDRGRALVLTPPGPRPHIGQPFPMGLVGSDFWLPPLGGEDQDPRSSFDWRLAPLPAVAATAGPDRSFHTFMRFDRDVTGCRLRAFGDGLQFERRCEMRAHRLVITDRVRSRLEVTIRPTSILLPMGWPVERLKPSLRVGEKSPPVVWEKAGRSAGPLGPLQVHRVSLVVRLVDRDWITLKLTLDVPELAWSE